MRPEGEPIRIPVTTVNGRDVTPSTEPLKALPPGEITVFSPKQSSRLATFHNILRRIHQDEQYLRANNEPNQFGKAKPGGGIAEVWMTMDSRFLNTWSHVADSMYQTELSQVETTKRAALDITKAVKAEFDGPEAMSAEEARDLFKR